jgi:hypothetical protein
MMLGDLWWKWLEWRKLLARLLVGRYRINHHRIILDLTFACNLKCYHCNRSCTQAPSDDSMSVDQVRKFVRESTEAQRRWSHIQLEGGEPTLHPELAAILSLLVQYKQNHSPQTQLILCTNGAGWNDAVSRRIPREVVVWNSRKQGRFHEQFVMFNRAPADEPRYGKADFTRACHIPSFWGIGLNRYGYYPCSVSGGIDRVFGFDIGRKSLPNEQDAMAEECRASCRWCGHFILFNRVRGPEDMSASWRRAYSSYAESKPALTLY